MTSFWEDTRRDILGAARGSLVAAVLVLVGLGGGLNKLLSAIIDYNASLGQAYVVVLIGYFGSIGMLAAHVCWWMSCGLPVSSGTVLKYTGLSLAGYLIAGLVATMYVPLGIPKTVFLTVLYVVICFTPLFIAGKPRSRRRFWWVPGGIASVALPAVILFYLLTGSHYHIQSNDAIAGIDTSYAHATFNYQRALWQWNTLPKQTMDSLLVADHWDTEEDSIVQVPGTGEFGITSRTILAGGRSSPVLRAFAAASYRFWLYAAELHTIGAIVLAMAFSALGLQAWLAWRSLVKRSKAGSIVVAPHDTPRGADVDHFTYTGMACIVVVLLAIPMLHAPAIDQVNVACPASLVHRSGASILPTTPSSARDATGLPETVPQGDASTKLVISDSTLYVHPRDSLRSDYEHKIGALQMQLSELGSAMGQIARFMSAVDSELVAHANIETMRKDTLYEKWRQQVRNLSQPSIK